MSRRVALPLSGFSFLLGALLLGGCADISTGAYQSSGYGREAYDAGIYDKGGLYEPGLYDGGVDRGGVDGGGHKGNGDGVDDGRPAPLTGGDGRIDDRAL